MKILLIQLAKLGDIIQSFPLIGDLMKNTPEPEIFVLHSEVFQESLSLLKGLNPITINLDKAVSYIDGSYTLVKNAYCQKLIDELSEYNFDLIINLNSTEIAKGLIQMINAKEKRGFGSENSKDNEYLSLILAFMKNRRLDSFNLVDIFRSLYSSDFKSSYWNKAEKQSKPTGEIILQLGSRNYKRNPGLKFYINLANDLISKGYKITLSGVESEKALGEEFIKGVYQFPRLNNMIGKTSLEELKQLISEADYLITGDTGTMHLASMTDTRIIALFGGSAYPYETLAYSSQAYTYYPQFKSCNLYPCHELLNCPYGCVCTEFDYHKLVDFITDNKGDNQILRTRFDGIGQYLSPTVENAAITNPGAVFWRKIVAEYFFNKPIDIDDYFNSYDFNEEYKADFIQKIKREFMLAQNLDTINDIDTITQNFNFLSPLLIFSLIYKSKSTLAESVQKAVF